MNNLLRIIWYNAKDFHEFEVLINQKGYIITNKEKLKELFDKK